MSARFILDDPGPDPAMPSWVSQVLLTRYSGAWQYEHGLVRGRCDAPTAPAFRGAFPYGCQRRSGHGGDHTPMEGLGRAMDAQDKEVEPWPGGPESDPLVYVW